MIYVYQNKAVNMTNILIFDISRENRILELKVNRQLHKIQARMIQHSVWKSKNLQGLMSIAMKIKKSGGSARILEERFVF